MSEFAAAIGLSDNWPINVENDDEMGVSGLLIWALAYFRAAEQLHFSDANVRQTPYYSGPIMQNVGLATELTLKAMLYGCGKTMDELRNYSHNTYNAYCDARACFDEVKFIDLHISCTSYMTVPAEVRSRYAEQGKEDVDIRWRVYFDHLRLLDSVDPEGVFNHAFHSVLEAVYGSTYMT